MGRTLSPSGTGKRDPLRKAHRRENAELNQVEVDKQSPKQRLQALDARLGKGKGAAKERARLTKLMNK